MGLQWGEAESNLVGRIYDAAIDPGLWEPLLGHISDGLGGTSAYLIFQDQITGKGHSLSIRADPAQRDPYFGYFATRNPLLKIRDRAGALCVMTDEDKLPKDELVRTEYYNDFGRRFGIHSTLIVRLALDGPRTAVLNVVRPASRESFGRGDIELATHVHPHLVRAFRLATKLSGMETLQHSLEDALDRSAHALFLVDARAVVCHLNQRGERLVASDAGLSLRNGILCTAGHEGTVRLHALIAAAGTGDAEHRTGGDMTLARPNRLLPLSIAVSPARSERSELSFSRSSVLVCVSDPDAGIGITDRRLRDALGLSRAETRLAVLLLEGKSLKEAARALGVSYHTVRGHLVRMFAKTGASRQSDLIRLMMRVADQT